MNRKPAATAKKGGAKKAPTNKLLPGSFAPLVEKKGTGTRKTSLSGYAGKASSAKVPVTGYAPASKKSAARAAHSGQLAGGLSDRAPNVKTQAAMNEARELAAAFKKRHGLS